jgi:hypothetical protein
MHTAIWGSYFLLGPSMQCCRCCTSFPLLRALRKYSLFLQSYTDSKPGRLRDARRSAAWEPPLLLSENSPTGQNSLYGSRLDSHRTLSYY